MQANHLADVRRADAIKNGFLGTGVLGNSGLQME
jgi:hypothetical protein